MGVNGKTKVLLSIKTRNKFFVNFVIHFAVGNGSIIYLAENVLFRNFWENSRLMLCNAVFWEAIVNLIHLTTGGIFASSNSSDFLAEQKISS